MISIRSSMPCVAAFAVGGLAACSRDATFTEPVPPLAAIHWVNAVPDTNKMAFRPVDIVSNAGLFGATFRSANMFYQGIEAGARHIRVFFDTTDVSLAKIVLLDTTYTFTENGHYTFAAYGSARVGPLQALVVQDAPQPTVPAGQFAIRVVNLAPSFAGAVPTLPDTTVHPDAFVRPMSALVAGVPEAANIGYLGNSAYVTLDTGVYRVALAPTGTTGPVIVQATVPTGILGTTTANPIAGSLVPGSVLTAVIVPRSVAGSTAPQGGRPTAKATEVLTRSNDTVTVQSGSIMILTNRSGGKADSTLAQTGTHASTGVSVTDNVLVTGANEPEYNGWQIVIQLADSLSCNPVNAGDTRTKCAAANDTATTRFRFRYLITGAPTSPATGTIVYRIYPPATASDYTIPFLFYLVDQRPPNTVP